MAGFTASISLRRRANRAPPRRAARHQRAVGSSNSALTSRSLPQAQMPLPACRWRKLCVKSAPFSAIRRRSLERKSGVFFSGAPNPACGRGGPASIGRLESRLKRGHGLLGLRISASLGFRHAAGTSVLWRGRSICRAPRTSDGRLIESRRNGRGDRWSCTPDAGL